MNGFDASLGCSSHPVLQFGEELLDRIEVRAVGWQEEEPGSGGSDNVAHHRAFVRAEIVENDDIAWLQGFDELGFDVGLESLAVDRPVEHPWRLDAIVPQGGNEGHGLPMAVGRMGDKPFAARAPATQRRHVRLDPGLIDEDQPCRVNARLVTDPLFAPALELWPQLLGGQNRFF